jgi:exopolysaccharide biosynthesis polyprenyl glycosylphosphotransferase
MYQKNTGGWTKHLDFMIWDIVCLQAAFFVAYVFRQRNFNLYGNTIYANLSWVLLLVDPLVMLFLNTMKNVLKRGRLRELAATIKNVAVVALVAVFYLFTVKDAGSFSRMTFFLMAIFYAMLSYLTRLSWKQHLLHKLTDRPQKSVLIITDHMQLDHVRKNIAERSYDMFQISGLVVLDGHEVGEVVEGVRIVANRYNMIEYICHRWVDEVFLELQPNSYYLDSIVHQLSSMGITIHIKLAEKIEIDGQRQFVEKMGKYTVLTTSINSATTMQFILKRLIDIVGGASGCVLTGILFIFIAPVIYYESPGPVIFSQTRIGRNGKKFKLYKFRSMYPDAELYKDELRYLNRNSDGMMFKLDYDPRIIGCYRQPDGSVKKGIGNFLRDWSLDEFPQFWNVLKGDMSLVGTRPPTEDEWEKYDLHHRSRLSIKPGITGMWQVNGRSRVTNFEQVVEMDRYYILNWNLGLDFKILAKTVPQVVGRSGAM